MASSIFWLQADAGTTPTTNGATVTSWNDQSNSNNLSQNGTGAEFVSVHKNFNPALDFTSTSGGYSMGNTAGVNSSASSAKSYSIAFTTGSDIITRQLIFEEGGGTHGLNIYITGGSLYTNLWVSSADNAASTVIEANTSYILSYVYDGVSTRWDAYLNGVIAFNDAIVPTSLPSHTGAIGLGLIDATTQYDPTTDVASGDSYLGLMMEYVYYNSKVFTTQERNQIESYLGLKYGISLGSDYLASDGLTTPWSATTNTGYNNGIAGIGLDNVLSDLNQKQAKSSNTDALVAIGLGTIATDNVSNANNFSGVNDFLVWGHNGGNPTFTGSNGPSNELILDRIWKVQETGTVENVLIQIPASTSSELIKLSGATDVNLLIDSDGDFSVGAVSSAMTLNGDNWEVTVDFTNGDYFSLSVPGAALSVASNGNETGPVDIVYTVTLASANNTGSTVTFDLDDNGTGTATSGLDYTAIPGSAQISILNGEQSGTFTVSITDDGLEEGTETLEVSISNPSTPLFTIGASNAVASIIDNDLSLPAGLSTNLAYWFKANKGTSTTTNGGSVSTWLDQSGNGLNSFIVGTGPTYSEVLTNFNPSVNFASIGGLTMDDNVLVNTISGSYTAKSYSIAFRTGSDVTTRQLIYEQGGGTHGLNLYIESSLLYNNLWVSGADNAASTSVTANTDYVLTFIYDGGNTRWDTYINGASAMNDASAPSTFSAHSGDIGIGVIDNTTQYDPSTDVNDGDVFGGHIHELVHFTDQIFSSTDRNQMESYLALKYGASLSTDYIASDGSTSFWDASSNTGYTSHIAGIGLDEVTALEQKQSKSNVSDALITMGLVSIVSDNISNTGSFSANRQFLMWGSNNSSVTFTGTGAPGGTLILNRQWKIQETAALGSVKLRVPDNSSSESTKLPSINSSILYLIVDDDGDFTNGGSTSYAMTLVGSNWEIDYDFSDGDYFSFTDSEATIVATVNGNETGPVDIVFTVTLAATNNSGSSITFDVDDAGTGSATSVDDYDAISGSAQVSIADGSQTGTFTIVVLDELTVESNETVIVTISNSSESNINIPTPSDTATIIDDDDAGPGGVLTDIEGWYRADLGTNTTTNGGSITSWDDQSGSSNLTEVDGGGGSPENPTYQTNVVNFNPIIRFTDPNSTDYSFLTTASNPLTQDMTLIAVFSTTQTDGGAAHWNSPAIIGADHGTTGDNYALGISSGQIHAKIESGDGYGARSTASFNDGETYIATATRVVSGNTVLYMDGVSTTTDASDAATLNDPNAIGIGNHESGTTASQFAGDIPEVILYSDDLTTAEKNRVESYLAIKYGFTLNNNEDYTNSDGVAVWDYSANTAYHNDLGGIARDDIGKFAQKQSKSNQSDALVTIGLGSIATDISSNSNNFSTDKSYLIWGNDDGTLGGVASNVDLTPESGAVDQLQRKWKIVETGTIGSVQFAFPKASIDGFFTLSSYGNYFLRVADDEALTTNVVDILLTETTINSVVSYAGTHDFDGTKFFTIVQSNFILWTGTEWRGGLSSLTDHAPSDEAGEATKTMYILATEAILNEAVAITNLEISASASLQVNPTSCLILTGTVTNNGSVSFEADATGYAQYKGPSIVARFEQYIDNEGWHHIGSPFSDVQWDDFIFLSSNGQLNHPLEGVSLDTCNYCNVWQYDPTTDIGTNIGFGSSTAYGTWRSSINSSQNFSADRGWNLYLDGSSSFGTAPWTISLSGTFNAGDKDQIVNENNGGWNLVANPYPSALDWDVVDDDIAGDNIALGYHIWDETNTVYATYLSGSGTLGANQHIAPFQGFYVQTATDGAQNSGDVFHTFSLEDNDRPSSCQTSGGFFKTTSTDRIVIKTTYLGSGKIDETILVFDDLASHNFNPSEDANKLFSPNRDVANVYARFKSHYTSISAINYPIDREDVLVGVKALNNQSISIELTEYPQSWTIYLEDLKTGFWYEVNDLLHTFTQDNEFRDRFRLYYSRNSFEPGKATGNPFVAFISDGEMIIEAERSITNSDWQLVSLTGAIVKTGNLNLKVAEQKSVTLDNLQSGIYILSMFSRDKSFSQKIPYIR